MEANERVKDTQEKQELWSWGAGTEGQLGTGKLQDEHLPQLIHILPSLSLLSCGGAHVIALTHGMHTLVCVCSLACLYLYRPSLLCRKKKVYLGKRHTSGQHGHGDKNVGNFLFVEMGHLEVNVSSISANGDHSAALSYEGDVLMLGAAIMGFLTIIKGSSIPAILLWFAEDLNKDKLKKIPSLNMIKVVEIASGSEHSVLTTGKHFLFRRCLRRDVAGWASSCVSGTTSTSGPVDSQKRVTGGEFWLKKVVYGYQFEKVRNWFGFGLFGSS
ncbi:hypothetical protein E3N88_44084 [Mikania micrantha]|uniref:Uncharacterized protein n=1 Tax=Mikania micrantha TaxID=192012 RepID=A0A5N6LD95_9ASTR|nr:hypothetical protein E3N88_44084 [Mikania micrantha]